MLIPLVASDPNLLMPLLQPPDFSDPPDSRSVRASTYPTTKTCIRTTCELVVELYFTTSATADSTSRSNLRIAQILKKPVFLNRLVL